MPRLSIYVSAEMKQRMDAFGDSVNWSRAAQKAFDAEMGIRTPISSLPRRVVHQVAARWAQNTLVLARRQFAKRRYCIST